MIQHTNYISDTMPHKPVKFNMLQPGHFVRPSSGRRNEAHSSDLSSPTIVKICVSIAILIIRHSSLSCAGDTTVLHIIIDNLIVRAGDNLRGKVCESHHRRLRQVNRTTYRRRCRESFQMILTSVCTKARAYRLLF